MGHAVLRVLSLDLHDLIHNARCRVHINNEFAVDRLESKLDFGSGCLDNLGCCYGIKWWGVHPVFEFRKLVWLARESGTETDSNPRKSQEG